MYTTDHTTATRHIMRWSLSVFILCGQWALAQPAHDACASQSTIAQGTEKRNDGNTIDGDGCPSDRTIPIICGDGYVHPTLEECDDGNTIDGDGCESDCTWPCVCGDGILNDTPSCNEWCDDGNTIDGDGCNNDCWSGETYLNDDCIMAYPVVDGTTVYDLTYATDDGPELRVCDPHFSGSNFIYNDVWYAYIAPCDGTLVVQTCDPDTAIDTKLAVYDTCTCPDSDEHIVACDDDTCDLESFVYTPAVQYACYLIQVGTYAQTSTAGEGLLTVACLPTMCGNGYMEPGEECDDGNTIDDDGCSDCTVACVCGDGIINDLPTCGESCEDGNTMSGDGCDSQCVRELLPGATCDHPIEVSFGPPAYYIDVNSTSGMWNDYDNTCMGYYDGGEDIIYELFIPVGLTAMFTLDADDNYAGIALHDTCPLDPSTCIAKDTTTHNPKEISFVHLSPGYYYLMVDSWPPPDFVNYTLEIEAWVDSFACCVDDVCHDMFYSADCAAIGGTAYIGETCSGSFACPPAHDECDGAIEIVDGSNAFDTTGATSTPIVTMCDAHLQEEVWYTYTYDEQTCGTPAEITFHTCANSSGDTVLEVFSGDDCDTMVSVGCSDDDCPQGGYRSLITVDASVGDVYYVAVSAYNGGAFSGDLSVDCVHYDPLCVGVDCSDLDGPCCEGVCNPADGLCYGNPINEGASCGVSMVCQDCVCTEVLPDVCTSDLDCVFLYNSCCGWDNCVEGTGICDTPIPNMFGDVCGSDFHLPPNGAVNLTDVLCTLNAFGLNNLINCPNADIAVVNASSCPGGNQVVNLTDILRILDAFGAPSAPTATFFCECPTNP